MTSSIFQDGGHRVANLLSGLVMQRLRRRQSNCLPNVDEISQPMTEIKQLPVSENGLTPHFYRAAWNAVAV